MQVFSLAVDILTVLADIATIIVLIMIIREVKK